MSRVRFRRWWREARRRLGLRIYGKPGSLLVMVKGWPPTSEEELIRLSKEEWAGRVGLGRGDAHPRPASLSAAERDYWEAKGVHIYWETGTE